MSSEIKPPGAGGVTPNVGGADSSAPSEGTGEAFRAALEGSAPVEGAAPVAQSADASSSATQGIEGIAAELRAGRVDSSQAVEQLLTRALSSASARALPPAERARLESMLRSAIAEDPTLAAMQKDLTRGR